MPATKTSQSRKKKAAASAKKALLMAPVKDAAVKKSDPTVKRPAAKSAASKPSAASPKTSAVPSDGPSIRSLPNVFQLFRTSLMLLWRNKKLFGGIALVYIICNLLLVQTANATNLAQYKSSIEGSSAAGGNPLTTGLALFGVLVSRAGNGAGQTGAAYQSFLLVIVSLAIIWALRETMAGQTVRVRDSFYKGMYPLVPSLLVLLMIFVHLIPLATGSFIFGIIEANGIATNGLQLLLWMIIPLIGLCVSIYFLLHSLFAAYVVTLPDMTPLKALRSAKKVVRYRRWTLLRKLLFLPIALLAAGVVVMLPFVLWLTPAAPWIFFILSTGALLIFQAYMYTLYRELLV